jgi:large conductance mechanosensitive channel
VITEFKAFLQKNNVMALAIGFILGAAVGKVVTASVNDLLMPIIGLAIPGGDWRQMAIPIGGSKLLVGDFLGAVLDFTIIAFAVFMIGKMFLKPEPTPDTKICPQCTEVVAKAASRCKYCTQPV